MDDKHRTGAVSELIAQTWFLKNDYEVFVPIVQQNLYDLVVYKNNQFQSVQVKTAYQMWSGKLSYHLVRLGRTRYKDNGKVTKDYKETEKFDFLFVVKENVPSSGMTLNCLNTTDYTHEQFCFCLCTNLG